MSRGFTRERALKMYKAQLDAMSTSPKSYFPGNVIVVTNLYLILIFIFLQHNSPPSPSPIFHANDHNNCKLSIIIGHEILMEYF